MGDYRPSGRWHWGKDRVKISSLRPERVLLKFTPMDEVQVWKEEVIIPTYGVGKPEKNPMFLEKRVYQGSSGVVYPHPIIEKIYDEKKDQKYQAIFLENEYLKIMILPQLGGRVQMAWDKVQQRHFIYYNQVIKPALVGLTGPWISGGIEFNWPQHHRPSTFAPIDHCIQENADGSKTVWVNEVELMFRTKGLAGFTLYPGKAYLEITGKLYNRTPFPQSFLWWANPAVKVNDRYQSVFPPDVHAVFDHGKRDVSTFPIANGVYYKVDYSPGTDISRYKNIPVPTSYMAIRSKYNFIGGYEHDTGAGMLHVADHHISPGKKQWTWGNGDFGKAWDRNLTDEDGPYIELMTGIFTDNQPDFSWIRPQEEKEFTQYFMPYSKLGMVKNATREAMVNLETANGRVYIKIYATAEYVNATISLYNHQGLLFEGYGTLSPRHVFEHVLAYDAPDKSGLKIIVKDEGGRILVDYQPGSDEFREAPLAATPALAPRDIPTTELLYLNGLHIEQYRHATYVASDYYEEALRRDENDTRNNNALGLWYLRRGQFARAEMYFRTAILRLTDRNPNSYDGEPWYNLGWALKMQGKNGEAYDAFYKSVWNDASQHAGYFALARIAAAEKKFEHALRLIDQSLVKNWHSHSVRHLKAVLLRKCGRVGKALALIAESYAVDPFNYGCWFERFLILETENPIEAKKVLNELKDLMRDHVHNYIEYALDYGHAGLYEEAIRLLGIYVEDKNEVYPMVYYYMGWFSMQLNLCEQAKLFFKKAAAMEPDYCFPHRIEDVVVLQTAKRIQPMDARAPYYLGNFWYDKRQYPEAIKNWERSAGLDNSFPTVHRNLSLAYHNKAADPARAVAFLRKAFELDDSDARVLMELDQLYKKTNRPLKERLGLLEEYQVLVEERDDLYLERIILLNNSGEFERAKDLIARRHFHPWEGGEGKVVRQFLVVHIELAKKAFRTADFNKALDLFKHTEQYPPNLGEGKLYGTKENDIHYLQASAYEGLGLKQEAVIYFEKATVGNDEPVQSIFYNDPQPDKIFYQGLAWIKLGELERANGIFNRLIEFGNQHLNDPMQIDYFAVSLPDLLVFDQDLNFKNKLHCLYMIGLGWLGLGNYEDAGRYFQKVLGHDLYHQGANIQIHMIEFLKNCS
jgi:tetratricopeptide (TPR) repeat protein